MSGGTRWKLMQMAQCLNLLIYLYYIMDPAEPMIDIQCIFEKSQSASLRGVGACTSPLHIYKLPSFHLVFRCSVYTDTH